MAKIKKNESVEILLQSAEVIKNKILEYVEKHYDLTDVKNYIETVFYEELEI